MRILGLDYSPVFGDEARAAQFRGDASAFDFDVVIWDPRWSLASYGTDVFRGRYRGLPSLSEDESATILADIHRRRLEFRDFLAMGRTLIVVLRSDLRFYAHTGEKQTSGTGRNQKVTHIVADHTLLSALPIEIPTPQRAQGDRIAAPGDGELATVLRAFRQHIEYAAVLPGPWGTVAATIEGTDRTVASVFEVDGGGRLILLPTTRFLPVEDDEDEDNDQGGGGRYPQEAVDFQDALIAAVRNLGSVDGQVRPAWADVYSTAETREAESAVTRQIASIERARSRLATLQGKLERAQLQQQLYYASGSSLELRVKEALELLGGEPLATIPGRADLRIRFGDATVVVEVKGLSKSAGERNSAQLEKWLASELEATGSNPKGVLVVNTWKDLPLAERTEADFPAQMIPYAVARSHCLITGLQLFVIVQDVRADPSRKEHWIELILNTNGPLASVPDWRTYLAEEAVESAG